MPVGCVICEASAAVVGEPAVGSIEVDMFYQTSRLSTGIQKSRQLSVGDSLGSPDGHCQIHILLLDAVSSIRQSLERMTVVHLSPRWILLLII